MKKLAAVIVILVPLLAGAQSQYYFTRIDTIPVYKNSQQLSFPWAGGMNFCQFSDIDLNQDGINDLFVFDRTGNKITTYVNLGTANQVDYVLAPQYVYQFPVLRDWVLLRDYNCDGKMDIFTSFSVLTPGIAVYKNVSSISAGLQFQLVTNAIQTDVTPNSTHNMQTLFVTSVDIPSIRDVDGDGDIDILTYDGAGVNVEFHENMSMDSFGVCDSLKFILGSQCWGEFAENTLNATISLNDSCPAPQRQANPGVQHNLHNGSCLECINTDGDNDQDILIGDLTNPHLVYGRNGGTPTFAKMDTVDPVFPAYNTSVNFPLFVCPYTVDVNNDGLKDLIVSPDAPNISENTNGTWLYMNTGAADSTRYAFVQNNFLQSQMIETGEGNYPRLFDYDNDGDDDLFIGNYGYYVSSGPYPGKIAFYKNTGGPLNPSFTFMTDDFANVHTQAPSLTVPVPAFGDLDGDGDEDMLVGDGTGKLNFFRKDPGPNDNFVFVQGNYQSIDVGNYATPQLVDVDGDGLIDLLIGEQSGNVNYYRNIGTASAPNFALITALFGNVNVREIGITTGYSVPYLWNDHGTNVLLVGSERGFVFRYDNVNSSTYTGTFTLTDSLYVSWREGLRSAPWMGNMNGDTIPDLLIGNYAGGVSVFSGNTGVWIDPHAEKDPFFTVYPNPASQQVTIQSSLSPAELPATIMLSNVAGQMVLNEEMQNASATIDISNFDPGLYLLTLKNKNGLVSHQKLLVK